MIIYGGWNERNCNDMMQFRFGTWQSLSFVIIYYLFAENQEWKEIIQKGNYANPRFGHSANVYGDTMIIFGGCAGLAVFNDLHSFDFSKQMHSLLNSNVHPSETHKWTEIIPINKENAPRPRRYLLCFHLVIYLLFSFHSAVIYNDKLYIIGGDIVKDFWSFDLGIMQYIYFKV